MFETINRPALTAPIPLTRLGWALCGCLFLLANQAHGASEGDPLSKTESHLETLFYTAQERHAITQARLGEFDEESSSIVRVTGIVKRTSGKSTAWINGHAVAEGQTQAPAVKTTISSASVTVDGQRVRVGEALDINTRQRADIVEPGAVTIRANK
jgi:hypothetical protein